MSSAERVNLTILLVAMLAAIILFAYLAGTAEDRHQQSVSRCMAFERFSAKDCEFIVRYLVEGEGEE
jgi:hypothetical protein